MQHLSKTYETCIWTFYQVMSIKIFQELLKNTHLHSSSILFQVQGVLLPYTRLEVLVHELQLHHVVLFRMILLLLEDKDIS